MRRIGRGPQTERLYAAEDVAAKALATAARRLEDVLAAAGLLDEKPDHYRDVRPEAIFTMLESQDANASAAAALGWLRWYAEHRPEVIGRARETFQAQTGQPFTLDPPPEVPDI